MVSGEEENKRSEVSENQKTDAASEGNANIVCKLLSGEEEGGENPWSAQRDDLCKSSLGTFLSRKVRFRPAKAKQIRLCNKLWFED